MSRFAATTKDGKEMAFGYDGPMQEYFVNVFDGDKMILDQNSSGQSMVPGGSTPPQSNSKIYEAIKSLMADYDWKIHQGKVDQILLDLPF